MKRRKLTIITVILMLLLTQSIILTGCKDEKNNESGTNTEDNENIDYGNDPVYFKHQICKKYKLVIPIEVPMSWTSPYRGTEGISLAGRIEKGKIKVGDKIEIIGQDPESGKEVTYFKDIEVLELYGNNEKHEPQLFDELKEEDNAGVYIEGIERNKLEGNKYVIIR